PTNQSKRRRAAGCGPHFSRDDNLDAGTDSRIRGDHTATGRGRGSCHVIGPRHRCSVSTRSNSISRIKGDIAQLPGPSALGPIRGSPSSESTRSRPWHAAFPPVTCPATGTPSPAWPRCPATGAEPAAVAGAGRRSCAAPGLERAYRLFKQVLGWTVPVRPTTRIEEPPPAPGYDVGKTAKRELTLKARSESPGQRHVRATAVRRRS